MKRTLLLPLLAAIFAVIPLADGPKRPKVLGVAHIAVYASDLAKTRAFYKDLLGFEEPFALKAKNGVDDRIAFIKINDYQYIELFSEPPRAQERLNHISFYTDDAHAMREYLAAQGVKVPDNVGKGQTGNFNYNILDPDGHIVEIVEYQPDSWTAREKGKFIPGTRISNRLMHVGVIVGSLSASMQFYHGILGFNEFWRGSGGEDTLSWVNMRVPDGQDYIEFMLYKELPEPDQRGGKNHLCLMAPDISKAIAVLQERPAFKDYGKKLEMHVGRNGKRQLNLYDPDGTRIELMEPTTVDGKPAPSSTAPAPRP